MRFIREYGLALAAVAAATAVRLLLDPWLGDQVVFATFYAAVVVAIWIAGTGPAIFVAALGYVLGAILFQQPRGTVWTDDPATYLRAISYGISCSLIILLGAFMRRANARLQAQSDALRESEQKLRISIQAGQLGAWEWDMKTNAVYWSPELEAIHGLEPGTFGGTIEAYSSDIHPDDKARVFATLQEEIARGDEHQIEYRIIWPDKTEHWVEGRGKVIRDAHGTPLKMTGVCTDITDRKRAEEELRTSEETFRNMLNSAPVLIWMSGEDKLASWFNTPWLEFVGRCLKKEEGYGWTENVHPDDLEECRQAYFDAFDARAPFSIKFRLRRSDGEYRWVINTGSPRYDAGGKFCGYIGSCVDINELHEAREVLEESDRKKDEFLATLAHELRNPLGPVRSGVEYLSAKEPPGGKKSEVIKVMRRQTEILGRLVDDLMDLNRIKRGTLKFVKERCDLRQIVDDAKQAVESLTRQANQQIHGRLSDPVYVLGDRTRLIQLFTNLLTNAHKFMPDGGDIYISGKTVAGNFQLDIKDTGRGMVPEELAGAFDMFSQWHHLAPERPLGLGVGLALAKQIVENHGGSIQAVSEGRGQGTTISVTLPTTTAPGQELIDIAPPTAIPRLRILIVDDNRDAADVLALLLQTQGHDVRVTYTGEEGLDAFKESRPDVVFMDLAMPGLNGYEVARRIREQAGGSDVPLIALSGWGQSGDIARSREAGFDKHLVKPVTLETLKLVLDTISAPGERV